MEFRPFWREAAFGSFRIFIPPREKLDIWRKTLHLGLLKVVIVFVVDLAVVRVAVAIIVVDVVDVRLLLAWRVLLRIVNSVWCKELVKWTSKRSFQKEQTPPTQAGTREEGDRSSLLLLL